MDTTKPDTISTVINAAMHMLEDSGMYGSKLWPKNGVRTGSGSLTDCIYLAVNAYGFPTVGRLVFNPPDTRRGDKQSDQIRLIFDYAIRDNIYFEYEFRNSTLVNKLWFKFTIEPGDSTNL
jgi:hypothetical protein